jgi:hypothetical protein
VAVVQGEKKRTQRADLVSWWLEMAISWEFHENDFGITEV